MAQEQSPTGPRQASPAAGARTGVGMKRLDQMAAIVLLALSAYVVAQSLRMPLWVEFAPGYGFFPFWLGVLMAALSALLLVDAARRPAARDEPNPFPKGTALLAVLGSMGVLVGYALFLESLGYILTTLLSVAFLMGVVQRDRWQTTLLTAVVVTGMLYVIFQVLLGIRLPAGFLGF